MLDALDVARHLVRVGFDPDSPEESVFICPLRLQKLLYYCQGWSLALLDRPLFHDELQAWEKGPVVREVYDKFSGSKQPIMPELAGEPKTKLSRTEAALVEMVWKEYSQYLPKQLVSMTHSEPAWNEARGDLPPKARSTARLSIETMRLFFAKLAQRKAIRPAPGFPLIHPAEVWRAESELEKSGGKAIAAKELFEGLLKEAK